ncbi:Deoxyribodipyrimidine photo-lyase-related protein [Pseudovibrio axinellae]|uniref:Deoxyribodipyrimidine photo-lyase-related protein n=1 Tax=Pseudovibrio axinellae TaxID=989403 RepID=A0A165XST3_9HYPH|nr:cryptochrome/photolyase family protein [Pseudovibrio axinellae]KZL18003.1 Deoxyribodipyrimidine photo-lyase-related protein [Pseudovibrio axinellae]SER13870.1 deoxyribodipyrimidine photolyase-related protein [Pseudovibrio axinellae]
MRLRLVLGDQLSLPLSSLRDVKLGEDVILMAEVNEEATYVRHHKKKIAFLFSAMRHFAEALRSLGHRVVYVPYGCPENTGSLFGEVLRLKEAEAVTEIIVTMPGEYRLLNEMESWQDRLGVPVELREDDRFLCSTEGFQKWASGRKSLRLEYFYREMRRNHDILMDGDKPLGGKWNYDHDNRQSAPKRLDVPAPFSVEPDRVTEEVLALVTDQFSEHFGDLKPFSLAVTREDALKALDQFVAERLSKFGNYQDAMVQGEPWMFHSHISFYLNCGLLLPLECVHAAERAYFDGTAPLNSVEGFIRQIVGWREFIRGIYWHSMPEYAGLNYLSASRDLPEFYWTGETQMNCLHQCIVETKANAYAHHIQRLMVIGNFSLLAGFAPKEVSEWYLAVYADAYEWVELPNVNGMILFADGGLFASKPYAASGAYINKMSNYCEHCVYAHATKTGEKACPFNYLYWNFLDQNEEKLRSNPRVSMIYRTWDKMSDSKKQEIRTDSRRFLALLDGSQA